LSRDRLFRFQITPHSIEMQPNIAQKRISRRAEARQKRTYVLTHNAEKAAAAAQQTPLTSARRAYRPLCARGIRNSGAYTTPTRQRLEPVHKGRRGPSRQPNGARQRLNAVTRREHRLAPPTSLSAAEAPKRRRRGIRPATPTDVERSRPDSPRNTEPRQGRRNPAVKRTRRDSIGAAKTGSRIRAWVGQIQDSRCATFQSLDSRATTIQSRPSINQSPVAIHDNRGCV